jgi:hypothetical protein
MDEATRYLHASGAVAIAIREVNSIARLAVNPRPAAGADLVWLPRDAAVALARTARQIAGPDPDVPRLSLALHEAAAQQKITLTEHRDAMQRAQQASNAFEATFLQMHREGRLRAFNRAYAEYRAAAVDRGEKVLPFSTALLRLKAVLIPQLAAGKSFAELRVNFAELFQERPQRPAPPRRRHDVDDW